MAVEAKQERKAALQDAVMSTLTRGSPGPILRASEMSENKPLSCPAGGGRGTRGSTVTHQLCCSLAEGG